jgi:hypothetical protein
MKIDPSQRLASTDDAGSGSTPGLTVWGLIVSELAGLQDAASPESHGSVVNPICGEPYIVDTCCAAAVFAAEFRRTDDHRWQKRADDAVTAARSGMPFRGIDEPSWDAFGWHDEPGSLPATGMAVDAYCDALNRMGLALDEDHIEDLLAFLLRCRTERGGFAHNALIVEQEAAEVQNAGASALNLLGCLSHGKRTEGHPVYTGLDGTLLRLGQGQIASGFWPYHYPGRRLRLREALDRWPFKALLKPGRFDTYHGHGDITHHLMTLYFAAGYFSSSRTSAETDMLASGWGWIRKRLVHGSDHRMSINWVGDPAPRSPQYSNARDTNAYFLILGAIPRLASLGIVDKDESSTIAEALLSHIDSNLTSEPGHAPCVTPREGPPEIARNILPMFEQSVAWKGRLMADVILAQCKAT